MALNPLRSSLLAQRLILSKLAKQKKAKTFIEAGFTLVELLIVVIIIGILAAVALPAFLNQSSKAKVSAGKSLVSAASKECQVWLVEGTGTFSQTTGGGTTVSLTPTQGNTTACSSATGGSWASTSTNPGFTFSASVSNVGAVTKSCSTATGVEGCTSNTW